MLISNIPMFFNLNVCYKPTRYITCIISTNELCWHNVTFVRKSFATKHSLAPT